MACSAVFGMRQPEMPVFYRVEIKASARRQVGALPNAVFERIQKELTSIAELAGYAPSLMTELGPRLPMHLVVGDFVVRYEVNVDAQAVVLLGATEQAENVRLSGT